MRTLEDAVPRCDGRVPRIAGPDQVLEDADRCPRCGECHVLVITEEVVEADPEGGVRRPT
jgi:hypothetical protein